MDVFDIVIMTVGAVLLVIGLFMFVSGKRSESSESQVEGFGVKLNISNPSVLLIVFGALLMLVPRLLPKPVDPGVLPDTTSDTRPQIDTSRPTDPAPQQPIEQVEKTPSPQPKTEPVYQPPPEVSQPQVFFPVGQWQLADFEENGVDLSANFRGEALFQKQSAMQTSWQANYQVMDIWGNSSFIQYSGTILYGGGGYSMQILQSTDPNFMGQITVPLIIKMEPGNRLHMEYFINGSKIIIHWVQ